VGKMNSLLSTWRLKPKEARAILVMGDLLVSYIALFVGIYFWWAGDAWLEVFNLEFFRLRVQLWFYFLPLVWLIFIIETYDIHRSMSWRRTFRSILISGLLAIIIYLLVYFLADIPGKINRRAVGVFIILSILLSLVWHWYYVKLMVSHGEQRRAFVIGAGSNGLALAEAYNQANPAPFNLVAYIDDNPNKLGTDVYGFKVIGGSENLIKLVEDFNISDLIVSITGVMKGETFKIILDLQERGVEVIRMPIIYEEITGRVPIHHLEYDWILRSFSDDVSGRLFYETLKRGLDIIGSIIGILIFALFFPFVSLAILFDTGLPIFYRQERLGVRAHSFKIIKFRTMKKDAESSGAAQMADENDPRITRVGNFLRATRIDELPQFFNVLIGDMSLVGPRAEREQWVSTFEEEIPFYRARLLVKPGISGWAQINYGYAATVEDTSVKLEYDLYYIKHRSIFLDILIILRTFGTVFSRKGR